MIYHSTELSIYEKAYYSQVLHWQGKIWNKTYRPSESDNELYRQWRDGCTAAVLDLKKNNSIEIPKNYEIPER
jgi:hypothetical protein